MAVKRETSNTPKVKKEPRESKNRGVPGGLKLFGRTLSNQVQLSFGMLIVLSLVSLSVIIVLALMISSIANRMEVERIPFAQEMVRIDETFDVLSKNITDYGLGVSSGYFQAESTYETLHYAMSRALEITTNKGFQSSLNITLKNLEKLHELLASVDLDSPDAGAVQFAEMDALFVEMKADVLPIVEMAWTTLQDDSDETVKHARWLRISSMGMAILILIVGIIASIWINKALAFVSKQVNSSNEQIRKRAFDAAASSEKVASSADQISHAMKEISSSVEQVTVGSSQSASATQEISNMMSRIHQMVQQIAAGADRTLREFSIFSENVAKTEEVAIRGQAMAEATDAAIKSAFESEKGASAGLQRLNEEVLRINEILTFIKNISTQTELLALNASIEAARAKEHGRGFAVVAEEIKKLSNQSSQSTQQISEIIDHINQVHEQIVAEFGQNLASSQVVVQQASSLKDGFIEFANGLKKLKVNMVQLVEIAKGQYDTTKDSSLLADRVLASTEEIAAQVEQVSAAMEELSATVEEVLAASEEMRANAMTQSESATELNSITDSVAEELKRLV